jgi:hypothetical protein
MNPYQSAPSEACQSDADSGSQEGRVARRDAHNELARRQIRLVIRLAFLSVATTGAAVTAFIVSGFEPITTAVALALILGIGFTVAWKV